MVMNNRHTRQYELVLFGATGYTGKYCAEYITSHLPTDLRWALAGRNEGKLSALKREVQSLNPNRTPPGIVISELDIEQLDRVAKQTRLIINTVGPYCLYGTPVIEACAKNGTHYLDVTGEFPWVLDMINKYHDTAKRNGAIVIPQIGFESAPADLTTWVLATTLKKTLNVGTKEVICCLHTFKSQPSGGTLATMRGLFDTYSPSQISQAAKRYALSTKPGPKSLRSRSLLEQLTGVRTTPEFGALTTAITTAPDTAIVHRSWSLLESVYGPNMEFNEYQIVRNIVVALIVKVAFAVVMFALVFSPLRWLLKQVSFAPGQGPTKEVANKEYIEFRALAIADQDTPSPRKATARLYYKGKGIYYLTGLLVAEAAMTILRPKLALEPSPEEKWGGGLLTPACLGQPFIDRLSKVEGWILTADMVEE